MTQVTSGVGEDTFDPTVPAAPMTNVAEYGFEGRFEDWAEDARYFEYSKAANPIGSGHISKVPITAFSRDLYIDGPTRIVPLDLSNDLGITDGPATSPALVAHFVRIRSGEQIATHPNATSQLYYVISGRGFSAVNGQLAQWEMGDFLTLPANSQATFYADPGSDAALYWVHDEPLLRHLGAEATEPRFRATKFRRADAVTRLNEIASRPGANEKSRVSVLLANAEQEQTLTITHVLWAMFGLLPPDQEQRPHRHQSVARSDSRRQGRLLHTAGHPTGRARRHHQPDPHRLGGRRRVRHGARPVARALQRVGRPGAPNPDPGRGPANLPTQPGHPVLRPPVM